MHFEISELWTYELSESVLYHEEGVNARDVDLNELGFG
jgi:hypothetical protein